jgi:hypothetical protein
MIFLVTNDIYSDININSMTYLQLFYSSMHDKS